MPNTTTTDTVRQQRQGRERNDCVPRDNNTIRRQLGWGLVAEARKSSSSR